MNTRQRQALAQENLDLFADYRPSLQPVPAPLASLPASPQPDAGLPDIADLVHLYDEFNFRYFNGQLPQVRIVYSERMRSTAGSYSAADATIRIGRRYHEVFPEELHDTLKHEMIHILNPRHDASFRKEAERLGTSVRARSHPELRRPPKYVYICPNCETEYPRQKRIRMASCGRCSRGGRFDERFKLTLKNI